MKMSNKLITTALFLTFFNFIQLNLYAQWERNIDGLSRYNFQNLNNGNNSRIDIKLGTGTSHKALYIGQDQASGGYGAYIDNRTGKNFTLKVNGHTKFSISQHGAVFGSENPTEQLDISGNLLVNVYKAYDIGGIYFRRGYSSTNERRNLSIQTRDFNQGGLTPDGLEINGNDGIMFGTLSTDRMFIRRDGNVGIGTTTPDHKLDVNGRIRAKEIKVETDWSDFVFNEDYTLKSLEEVETYISKNKHLPDIPSEAEVKAKGINLGEMNAKLLQKIEELMLYTIAQDKEIKKLKSENSRIEKQEKKIEKLETLVKQLIKNI